MGGPVGTARGEGGRVWSRRMVAGAVGALVTVGLAGCQKATVVGVYNGCEFPVEVAVNDADEVRPSLWERVDDGDRVSGWAVAGSSDEFFVWVREADGAPVTEFTVRRDELVAPEEGGHDLEVVVEGDRCPEPAEP